MARRVTDLPPCSRGSHELAVSFVGVLGYDPVYGAPNTPVGTMDAAITAVTSSFSTPPTLFAFDLPSGKLPNLDHYHDYTDLTSFGQPVAPTILRVDYVVARAVLEINLNDDGKPYSYRARTWISQRRQRFYTATRYYKEWWRERRWLRGGPHEEYGMVPGSEVLRSWEWNPEGDDGFCVPHPANFRLDASVSRPDFWVTWPHMRDADATFYKPDIIEPTLPITYSESLTTIDQIKWSFAPGYEPATPEDNGFPR